MSSFIGGVVIITIEIPSVYIVGIAVCIVVAAVFLLVWISPYIVSQIRMIKHCARINYRYGNITAAYVHVPHLLRADFFKPVLEIIVCIIGIGAKLVNIVRLRKFHI